MIKIIKMTIIFLLVMLCCGANDLPLDPPKVIPSAVVDEEEEEEEIEFYDEDIQVQNDSIIYVIDISGSMSLGGNTFLDLDGNLVASGTRLQRAKVELTRSVNSIPNYFKFNIMAYDCSVRKFSNSSILATQPNKTAANGWISGLSPSGGTGTGAAVSIALADRTNFTIILLSDGSPNCGNTYLAHLNMIRQNNTQRAKINVFGIDTSSYTRIFLVSVATDNNGVYVEIN